MTRTITLENGKKITISKESYDELARATQEIRVPGNIKLAPFSDGTVAIGFGNNQWLKYEPYHNTWVVSTTGYGPGPCKLVKVNKEDRVRGRVYVRDWTDDIQNLEDLEKYMLYLGDNKVVQVYGGDIIQDVHDGGNWWEVRTA